MFPMPSVETGTTDREVKEAKPKFLVDALGEVSRANFLFMRGAFVIVWIWL